MLIRRTISWEDNPSVCELTFGHYAYQYVLRKFSYCHCVYIYRWRCVPLPRLIEGETESSNIRCINGG